MRSLTNREVDLLQEGQFTQYFEVKVEHGEQEIDLMDFEGESWVERIQVNNDIDTATKSISLELKRNVHKLSFNLLMKDSKFNEIDGEYKPLLDLGKEITINTAIVELGTQKYEFPDEYWHEWEIGFIDRINMETDPIQIELRGLGGRIQDEYIREEEEYGNELVENIMQQMLNDNNMSHIDLKIEEDTAWVIEPYIQDKDHLLDALQTLAEQIGWQLRYKFYNLTGQHELVFYPPPRNPEEISWIFNHGDYTEVNRLEMDLSEIRNIVRITYSDSSQEDEDGVLGKRVYVQDINQDSIDKYGERYMEISEASNSQINTASEATTLMNNALHDLSWPKAQQEIETHFFFPMQLHDYYQFEPNGIHYDREQKFGVVSYSHDINFENHTKRTYITTTGHPNMSETGKPVGLHLRWFIKEALPGIAIRNIFFPPSQPQNLQVSPAVKGVNIKYDLNKERNLDGYKVYCSNQSDFIVNQNKVVAQGRSVQWNINKFYNESANSIETMETGEEYFVKVKAYDTRNNLSEVSLEGSAIAGGVDSGDLEDDSVTTQSLSSGSVTEDELADNAVSNPKIQTDAVQENNILNSSISTNKIQDGAVEELKLSENSVSTNKIQDGTITDTKLDEDYANDPHNNNEHSENYATETDVDNLDATDISLDDIDLRITGNTVQLGINALDEDLEYIYNAFANEGDDW